MSNTIATAASTGIFEVPNSFTSAESINFSGDIDFYRVDLKENTILTVDIDTFNGSSLDLFLRLFDGSGTELSFNDDNRLYAQDSQLRDPFLRFQAPQSGSYFVGVSDFSSRFYNPNFFIASSSSTGPFNITITASNPNQSNGDVGSLDGVFGTLGDDAYGANNGEIFYGRGGDDQLSVREEQSSNVDNTSILAGGTGSDTYIMSRNSTIVIAENGNSADDTFVEKFTEANSRPFALTVESRHLLIGDLFSNSYAIFLDWQQSENKIERFITSSGQSSSFIGALNNSFGSVSGNFSFSQLQQGIFITPQGSAFSELFELDLNQVGLSPSTVNAGINEILNRAVSKRDLVLRRGNRYFADTDLDGTPDVSLSFGRSSDIVEFADMNGDGSDDLVLRRGNRYFADTDLDGISDIALSFGRSSDIVEFADMNGDGRDNLVLRRGNRYFVDTDYLGVNPEISRSFGRSGDIVGFADQDGNGVTDLVLRRGNRYFADTDLDGTPDISRSFGRSSDIVEFADMNGDGSDDLVLRRGNRYFTDTNWNGTPDSSFSFGRSTDAITLSDLA